MASCLNSNKPDFDVEAFQQSDGTQQQQRARGTSGASGSRRRCCSPATWIASATLAAALLALLFGIYASVIAHRGLKAVRAAGDGQGVLFASRPSSLPGGYRTSGLFQGTGYYARMAPMLYARSDHRTLPVGNTVYIVGGLTDALDLAAPSPRGGAGAAAQRPRALVLNHTTAYNTYTQIYTRVADMPQPRYRMCGAVLDGAAYVIGGMPLYEGPTAPSHTVSDSVMRYDPASDTWTTLPGRLRHPRADCCAAAVGGKLYVAGGWTTDYADTLGSVEVWDPATGDWGMAPNLTLSRGDCEAVAVNDRHMLVLGGVTPDGNFTASVESLDVSTPGAAWQARAPMLRPRGDFAAEALPGGGRVIAMGGETSNGTATEFALHQAEEYAFESDAWTPKAPLPEARFRFDTAHVGEMVYVFGGAPTCVSGDVSDGAKQPCLGVALNSTWGYFDLRYPDVYIATRA